MLIDYYINFDLEPMVLLIDYFIIYLNTDV